ncbi:MAG: hypothetical protein ABR499_12175 [Gemmatimonadaceae bacterium]
MTIPTRETPAYQRLTPRAGLGSFAVVGPGASDAASRRLRLAALLLLAACLFGIFARDFLAHEGFARAVPSSGNVFFRLYALHEGPFLVLLAVFASLAWLAARRSGAVGGPARARSKSGSIGGPALLAAVAVLGVTLAGTIFVMHSTPLSMDEYAAAFQARILASGRMSAPVPVEWQPFTKALVPVFIAYRAAEQVWLSSYLPAYAALRAAFATAGADVLVNPLLAAGSVLSLAGVSARLWPGDLRRARVALLYLVTSSQFLLTSMTGYSWPAHLCFNLLWLYLILREDRLGLAAAPWVGVVALGLHNPFPHALFVAPFLIRLLRAKRVGWIAYFGTVYGVGALAWYRLMSFSHSQVGRGAAIEEFAAPAGQTFFVQGLNLSLLLTWQAPAMALFLVAAFFLLRSLKPAERDLMAGLVLTVAFYVLFPQNQGHGWGYRYAFSVLGNAALLAASATVGLAGKGAPARRLVALSAAAAILVQLPLRSFQAERFVRPYAATLDYIAGLPAEVVLVDPSSAYYGRDLVRNDPLFATRPVTLALPAVRPDDGRELLRRYPGRVYVLTVPEMQRLGLTTFGPGPTWVRR